MAAIEVLSVRHRVVGNVRENIYTINVAASGDSMYLPFHQIDTINGPVNTDIRRISLTPAGLPYGGYIVTIELTGGAMNMIRLVVVGV